MEKPLMKLKTLKTLYLDHFDNEWSDDNPKMWSTNYWYKCGPEFDYEVLRTGSILKVFIDDPEEQTICCVNKNHSIIFPSIECLKRQIEDCKWFKVVE